MFEEYAEFRQLGYDEALRPDPTDPAVPKHTVEDLELVRERRGMTLPELLAYQTGRLYRLELRGIHSRPSQTVFEVVSTPCRFGWTRGPVHRIDASAYEDPQRPRVRDGYRCVYFGDTADGLTMQYLNDTFAWQAGPGEFVVAERLLLQEVDATTLEVTRVRFDEITDRPDGVVHRHVREARAGALKCAFDDWRSSFTETPDERLVRVDR